MTSCGHAATAASSLARSDGASWPSAPSRSSVSSLEAASMPAYTSVDSMMGLPMTDSSVAFE
jgi:hypothetical protein